MASTSAPTSEVGHGQNSMASWDTFSNINEPVPELAFPNWIRIVDNMRNDAQIEAISRACVMPILRYNWQIDPNGAKARVVKEIAEDMNLPIKGKKQKTKGRIKNKFNHGEHLRHALLCLFYGFMPFEQSVRIDPVTEHARLKKLAPRMPGTIQQLIVAPDGGLDGVVQYPTYDTRPGHQPRIVPIRNDPRYGNNPFIDINRLVMYCNEREGANWYGRSILRTAYKNWLIKDRLLRVDALKHERNGMGIPDFEAPPNASQPVIDALTERAMKIRAGEYTGGASPAGSKLRLVGVEGSLPDTLASIKYHDEQMARMILAMFLQLGHTESGSRSLGQSFVDYFALAQESIANMYADITTAHVIEDLVDWNYGPDEQAPRLVYERITDAELSIVDLATAVQNGLVRVDDDLENFLRQRHNLPDSMTPRPDPMDPTNPLMQPPVHPRATPATNVIGPAAAAQAAKQADTANGQAPINPDKAPGPARSAFRPTNA